MFREIKISPELKTANGTEGQSRERPRALGKINAQKGTPLIAFKEKDGRVQSHDAVLNSAGLTPKVRPCDGLVNKLFTANIPRLYDDHMASNDVQRNEHGCLEAASRALLAQWVKKSWDALTADDILSSVKKAGPLYLFDGSEDETWAKNKLARTPRGGVLALAAPPPVADKKPDQAPTC